MTQNINSILLFDNVLQFFYTQNLSILASVEHGMAIGTDGNQVFNGINLVLLSYCRDGNNVMDMNEAFA